jgi:superfamily II DNA helicase RecQ
MMATPKKPTPKATVKPKSKLTGADITGQKYNTKIKEEAAKIRLKVRMKEKLTPYEKSVLGSDAAIKKMNTKSTSTPSKKPTPKATMKATAKPKPKLSKSEEAFLAGQKLKKKITKRTGVYPNTAN